MDPAFGKVLKRLRLRTGKSRYQLWKFSGLDQAYLGRLEKGLKGASRETVILIGLSLVYNSDMLTPEDVDELLLAAGYAPLRRRGHRSPLTVS